MSQQRSMSAGAGPGPATVIAPRFASSSLTTPPVTATASVAAIPATPAAPSEPFIRCSVVSYRSRTKLSKTFIEYCLAVKTPQLHWDSYARYSEFESLHKSLEKMIDSNSSLKQSL